MQTDVRTEATRTAPPILPVSRARKAAALWESYRAAFNAFHAAPSIETAEKSIEAFNAWVASLIEDAAARAAYDRGHRLRLARDLGVTPGVFS